mmetsp:Transcript_9354/g.10406  ORF Transcript_9354/g.10406 Transcript_9354/m.10406 type:complete len:82 (-) Transcript_9354:174-419(-)
MVYPDQGTEDLPNKSYRTNKFGNPKGKGKGKPKDKAATAPVKTHSKKWACKTEALKHDKFYCGDGMSNKVSTSRTNFLGSG